MVNRSFKALLFCYGGAHVQLIARLAAVLVERGHDIDIVGLTASPRVLELHGFKPHKITDFVDSQDGQIRKYGSILAEFHHTDGKGISMEESIAYLGNSFKELVDIYGEDAAWGEYKRQGLKAFLPVKICEKIIERFNPDVVVTTDSPRMERAALIAASRLGKPSACAIASFPDIGMHYLKLPDNGDIQLVLNEAVRMQLIDAGRDASTVFVTGNPGFDLLKVDHPKKKRVMLRRKLGLSDDDKVILWAEQPEPSNPNLPRAVRKFISDYCSSQPGLKAMIRLHPSSTDGSKEVIAKDAIYSEPSQSVVDALLISDVVVTFTSILGYEALLLNKPLIVLNLSEFSHYARYSQNVGALVIDDLQRVPAAINELAEGKSELSLSLERARAKLPEVGGAANNVINILEEYVRI